MPFIQFPLLLKYYITICHNSEANICPSLLTKVYTYLDFNSFFSCECPSVLGSYSLSCQIVYLSCLLHLIWSITIFQTFLVL